MVSHRIVLLAVLNVFAVLLFVSLLAEVLHLMGNRSLPQLTGELLAWADRVEYQKMMNGAVRARLNDLARLIFSTTCVNAIIIFGAASRLWNTIERCAASQAMRSALFHAIWSVFTLSLHEYCKVTLFSTWLLTMSDSGLGDLLASSDKSVVRPLMPLVVGVVAWFLAGYLAGRVSERWRSVVFPIITLLMLLQVACDVVLEPEFVQRASMIIPPGKVRDAIERATGELDFPRNNVRFRRGLLGAGQTFGMGNDIIIVLSGPHLGSLRADEWAALVAREVGHSKYHDLVARMFMRLCSRFLWAPSAFWLMFQPSLFSDFGVRTESLVMAFALTELYATKFDDLVLLIKQVAWRAMDARVDRYVVDASAVDRRTYAEVILKEAYLNRRPLTNSFLYSIFITGKWSPLDRARGILEHSTPTPGGVELR